MLLTWLTRVNVRGLRLIYTLNSDGKQGKVGEVARSPGLPWFGLFAREIIQPSLESYGIITLAPSLLSSYTRQLSRGD